MRVEMSDKQVEQLKDRIQGFIDASIVSMNEDSEDWGLGEMEELHELKSVVDVKIDRIVPYVGIKTYINIYTDSKREDFDMTQMTDRFKAPNINYAKEIFMNDDPKEIFIAINELSYNIFIKNVINSCYWIEWIMNFESICKSKKDKIKCERRTQMPVDSKNQMDIIWIVWDLFLKESKKQSNIIQKVINSLLNLFTLKYTFGCQKKRKYILYFVISVLCENINFEEEIIRETQKEVLTNVIKKIDSIYKQIKKNEESPGTEYLFKDTKSIELEKTIEKLEKMNTFGETFIPRI